ncbi:MAG: hypothetical protein KDD89_13950, partial [Anaerolineales bacterium]|nr:hypothetical protein [Anaerolineales bacterium]
TSRYEQMQTWAERALALLPTAVDKTPVYDNLLQASMIQREYHAGTQLGLSVLRELGLSLPETTTPEAIRAEMTAVRDLWQDQNILALGNRAAVADPRIISLMLILYRLNSLMPFTHPQAYPLVALAQVRLSLEQGTSRYSANAFVVYAITLLADEGDIEAGYQFARLALAVLRKHKAREFEAHVQFAFNALIRFWREPLDSTIGALLDIYTTGQETGDYFHGSLASMVHFLHAFWHGRELEQIESGLETYQTAISRLQSGYFTPRFQLYRQMMRALMGRTAALTSFATPANDLTIPPDEVYDEAAVLASFSARHDQTSIASWHIFKLILHYLYEEYEQAEEAATAVGERLVYFKSGYWVIVFNFYQSLTALAQCAQLAPDSPAWAEKMALVQRNQTQLVGWLAHAPQNTEVYWQLVEAERHRAEQRLGQARLHYEKAITLARQGGYMHLRALAHERAGTFFLQEGHEWLARFFLTEAHYAYTRWGAYAKADWLRSSYPNIVVHSTQNEDVTTTRIRAT